MKIAKYIVIGALLGSMEHGDVVSAIKLQSAGPLEMSIPTLDNPFPQIIPPNLPTPKADTPDPPENYQDKKLAEAQKKIDKEEGKDPDARFDEPKPGKIVTDAELKSKEEQRKEKEEADKIKKLEESMSQKAKELEEKEKEDLEKKKKADAEDDDKIPDSVKKLSDNEDAKAKLNSEVNDLANQADERKLKKLIAAREARKAEKEAEEQAKKDEEAEKLKNVQDYRSAVLNKITRGDNLPTIDEVDKAKKDQQAQESVARAKVAKSMFSNLMGGMSNKEKTVHNLQKDFLTSDGRAEALEAKKLEGQKNAVMAGEIQQKQDQIHRDGYTVDENWTAAMPNQYLAQKQSKK